MESRIRCIFGEHFDEVSVDGVKLDPGESLKLRNHSPTGFAWGYGGSGPAQTALAILLHVLNDERQALALYQDFKWDHVSRWPQGEDVDVAIDVPVWAARKRRDFEANDDGS